MDESTNNGGANSGDEDEWYPFIPGPEPDGKSPAGERPFAGGGEAPLSSFSELSNPPRLKPANSSSAAGRTYFEILTHLRLELLGSDDVLRRLATLGDHRYRAAGPATRILLVGPAGSGKSSLARSFADSLGLPPVTLDASAIVEHGFQGMTPGDVVKTVWSAVGCNQRNLDAGVVLVLEGMDRATRRVTDRWQADGDWHGDAVRLSRQGAIANLLSTTVPIGVDLEVGSRERQWLDVSTASWTVVCTGSFDLGARGHYGRRSIGDEALSAWGMCGLIRAFTTRVTLSVHSGPMLIEVLELHRAARSVIAAAGEFGFDLVFAPETMRLAIHAAAASESATDAAANLLIDAGVRCIGKALEQGGPREMRILTNGSVLSRVL